VSAGVSSKLVGSADVMLLPGIADSLAGRVEVLSL
jgi:hypothetical protein